MTIHLDHSVAVASGSHEQVQAWGRILKAAKVDFEVVEPCLAESSNSDHVEVWVARDECEKARAALQKKDGNTRLW
jgi:hypothetical protein